MGSDQVGAPNGHDPREQGARIAAVNLVCYVVKINGITEDAPVQLLHYMPDINY